MLVSRNGDSPLCDKSFLKLAVAIETSYSELYADIQISKTIKHPKNCTRAKVHVVCSWQSDIQYLFPVPFDMVTVLKFFFDWLTYNSVIFKSKQRYLSSDNALQ